MAERATIDAPGGYEVSGSTGRFHVDSLDDLTIYNADGVEVDLLPVDTAFTAVGRLPSDGYIVIDVVFGPESVRDEFEQEHADDPVTTLPPNRVRRRREGIRVNSRQAEVVSHLLPSLVERLGETAEPAESIVERMIASIPRASLGRRWQELIGPFYSANDIAAWRGVTRQNIHKLRGSGKLLAVQPKNDKILLFPAWQFGPDGEELPHLREIVSELGLAAPDEWARALWLNQKTDRFDGRSAADLLKTGEIDRVRAAAQSDAAGMVA